MDNQSMEKVMRKYEGKHLTPVRSIKLYCKEMCCAGDLQSWNNCTFISCFLYPYRLGHRIAKTSKKQADSPKNKATSGH